MPNSRRRFLQVCRRRCPAAGHAVCRAGAGLSDAAGAAIIVGQAAGSSSDIAARLIAAVLSRAARPAVRGREPARRRRQHRDRRRGPRGTGRLHAAAGRRAERHQRRALQKLNYDFVRDIAPVAASTRVPLVMEVQSSVPAKPLRNSSPTPRPIRASSTWRRPASAARSMSPASCSRPWPVSTSCTCPIAARRRR